MVDGDEKFGDVALLDAGMDVGVALVDALDRRGALSSGDVADELTEDGAPVDDVRHRAADGIAEFGGDVSPAVGLTVCVFRGLLHGVGHLAGHQVAHLLGDVVPCAVVVEGVEVAHAVAGLHLAVLLHLVDLVLEFLEVPLRGLVLGEGGDETCDGHGVLLLLGPLAAFRRLREFAGEETARGKCHVGVTGDDGVDGEVRRDVPHLGRRLAARAEVAEDEVVELVREDTTDLLIGHAAEELRVPVQRDVVELGVERNRRRGHRVRRGLPDVPGQFRKERRVLEEGDEVPVQVEVGLDGVEHDVSYHFLLEVCTGLVLLELGFHGRLAGPAGTDPSTRVEFVRAQGEYLPVVFLAVDPPETRPRAEDVLRGLNPGLVDLHLQDGTGRHVVRGGLREGVECRRALEKFERVHVVSPDVQP